MGICCDIDPESLRYIPEEVRDDLEWMKDRVSVDPSLYRFASPGLRKNKEFFLHYLDVLKNNRFKTRYYTFPTGGRFEDCFYRDKEVKKKIIEVLGKKFVPGTKEHAMEQLNDMLTSGEYDEETPRNYRFHCFAVKLDVFNIRFCPEWAQVRFSQDPKMQEFILKHIYEIYWVFKVSREDIYDYPQVFPFSDLIKSHSEVDPNFRVERSHHAGPGGYFQPDLRHIDKGSIMEILKRYPWDLELEYRRLLNLDIVCQSVKEDGNIFLHLDPEYQNNPIVRRAIGPLRNSKIIPKGKAV